ncbi:MAG: DUF3800 domain-containing protein, partial [Mogibacterium sp.]|nr:DUF3800 domain-containing protein [Mogibacterium sp.]
MEYNIYCDESCHLENDGSNTMVIGGIRCPRTSRKRIIRDIMRIKAKHGIPERAEIKWTKVSKCNVNYFKELVSYYFDCPNLSFRSVVIDKTKLNHETHNQT